MIIHTIHGHSHYATNQMFFPPSFPFMHLFVHNFRCLLCVSKLTMAVNLITPHPAHSSPRTALPFDTTVHTRHNKMDAWNACFAHSTMAFVRCCSGQLSPFPSGLMPLWPQLISSISVRANHVSTLLPLSSSWARYLTTATFGYLGAYVTRTSLPLHHINSHHDQCAACSLAIPLIKKDTSAITWKANVLLSHVTSISTRHVFHLCRDRLVQHQPNCAHHASRTRS